MNLRCILRWTIYLLGIIGAILSIFCFAADQNDNNQASQANPNASNKTFGNFFTLILSVAAVVPLFLHYNTPKLFYMLIYILPGLIAMICAIYYFWLTIKEMIATGGANDSMVQRLTKGEPKQASSNLDNASSHGGSKTRSSKRSSKA